MNTNFIEVECGKYAWVNSKLVVEGDSTDNGWCFKDYSAWKNNKGVIYIGEYQLSDYMQGNCDIDDLWTRESWIKWVADEIARKYADEEDIADILACEEFISGIAYDCFEWADWCDLSTMLDDFECNDDWVLTNWEEWKENH